MCIRDSPKPQNPKTPKGDWKCCVLRHIINKREFNVNKMQCLQLLRKKGRSKRLYSQANIPYTQSISDTVPDNTQPEVKVTTEKRNHIESKNPTLNELVTLTKETKDEFLAVDRRASSEKAEEKSLVPFTMRPYFEYNQQLSLELLMRFLNSIREEHKEGSHKHKLASILYDHLVPKVRCVLPPFEDVTFNEKRICCEVWKAHREQVHAVLSQTARSSSLLLDWTLSSASNVLLQCCNEYQTKAEKLAQLRVVKQEPRNQVSHTLIQCSEVFSKL
eukprot:TRINITY_DN11292_c0_g1_i1.p1 TRINITY_DN11292_c0_g1~~TRINITY_DN11292_c0_g1_i1.p1  ORF type:complete len:275 (+),score=30.42 TRINITY_DN11292_c0_g1_i1:73-897(+)